jgi:hypothetical protein
MQMALEALELYQSKSSVQMFDDAVKALRQALETKQEPVAWRYKYPDGVWRFSNGERVNGSDPIKSQPLYTTPPKREWVGLTAYEIQEIHSGNQHWGNFACAIEAKLREKNHG